VEPDAGSGQVPLEVSRRIKEEFENGHDHHALHDREYTAPRVPRLDRMRLCSRGTMKSAISDE
jgi:hypothetical protein